MVQFSTDGTILEDKRGYNYSVSIINIVQNNRVSGNYFQIEKNKH